jgi:hypothetical protein
MSLNFNSLPGKERAETRRMIFHAVKALRTAGGCMLFLGLTVAVLAAQNTAITRTTLSIAANDAGPRTRVTLTAHVSATSGEAAPGVVTFHSENLDLGSAIVDSEGNASLETDVLPQGDHRVVALYKGSQTYQASVSAEEQVHANVSTVAGFTVAAAPSSLTTPVGGFASSVVTVTPVNGFNAVVSLSCSGLPVNTTCTFNPINVSPGCTSTAGVQNCSTASSVMQIQTLAPSPKIASGAASAFVLPLIFGLAGLGAWKQRSWRNLALILLACAAMSGLTACNPRYNYLNHGPPGNPGTPTGTYAITVNSESSIGSTVITPPTNPQITLIITGS